MRMPRYLDIRETHRSQDGITCSVRVKWWGWPVVLTLALAAIWTAWRPAR